MDWHRGRDWSMRVVSGALLVGCAETTTSPPSDDALGAPAKPSSVLLSSQSKDGSKLSVVDEYDGVTYTLNLASGELTRSSDGMVLSLTTEQRDSVGTAMAAIMRNDPSIPGLETIASRSPGQCTGLPGSPCLESVTTGGPGLVLRLISRETNDDQDDDQDDDPSKGRKRFKRFVRTSSTLPSFSVAALGGDMCTNIINAALGQTIEYHGKRSKFLTNAFIGATSVLFGQVTKNVLVPGAFAAIKLMYEVSDITQASIAIGFLRANWNDYNCDSTKVIAGPYYHSTGVYSLTPSPNFTCHDETWGISWDGGQTFQPQRVTVCEFTT
jgi:hypothetical protein